jgi:uncharacterized cupin superfamily protein
MTNVHEPHFEVEGDQPGFRYRRARLGYQAGCERLGVSLWELPPGETTPYGYHYENEELLIVLVGRPSMRTPEGWRDGREGDLVSFPVGEGGAHQFLNRTDAPARLLMFSEMKGPEVTVYPDSQKVGVYETMMSPERGGLGATFCIEDAVDYFEREHAPSPS